MKNILAYLIFFVVTFSSIVFADNIQITNIDISGNKSVSTDTVLEIVNFKKKNFQTDIDSINLMQKKLYETNFFSKVEIVIDQSKLRINLIENPLIEYIVVEGIDDFPTLKKSVEQNLSLKPNSIYSDLYLNNDIVFIKEYLSSKGFLQTDINYTINKLENDKLNIFFQINIGKKFKVKNIYFIGDKKFSSAKLSRYIKTTESSWYNFFSSTNIPSTDRINLDISSLKNFYLSEGFYDIQIPNASIQVIDSSYANVIFTIDSGNRYLVENLKVINNSSDLKNEDLNKLNLLGKNIINNFYDNQKILSLRDDIIFYLDNKELNSFIDYTVEKVPGKSSLLLNFSINDYKQKKIINNINVLGNDVTEESVIRNNILFSEGDILNNLKIKKSEDMLKGLGIFKKVLINELSDDNEKSNIEVRVEEQPTGEIGTGVGVGTSGSSISFLLRENNFLGKAIKTDVNLNLSTEQTLGTININNPDYNYSGKALIFNTFISKNSFDNAEYQNRLIGSNIGTKYEVLKNLTLETGFGLSYDSIDVTSSASSILQTQDGNYFTNKFFYDLNFDKTNKKFDPTSGYTFSFGQEYALIPSDIPYISNNINGSFFSKFSDDFIGSLKYRMKSIDSLNNKSMKLSDRVFPLSNELRGFAYRSVGPKINDDFIGGNYIVSSTISTTFPNFLPETWRATSNIFLDAANVWGSDLSNVSSSSKLRSSIGIGLNWNSPIGPFGISYAESLSKLSTDKTESFNFRLGSVF